MKKTPKKKTMNLIESSQKFKELSRILIEEVKRKSEEGINFQLEPYKVYVPDLRTMRYRNGKVEYFLETIEKQKYDIDFADKVPKFYEEFCVRLSEFSELKVNLEKFLGIKEDQAGNVIKNFIYNLIYKTNRGLNVDDLNHIVDKFILNLEVKTPYIKAKIFLDGIWLDREQLQINENLKIRRIKSADFETHSPEILKQQFDSFGNFPYIVLKYKIPLNFEIDNLLQFQAELLKRIRLLIYAFLLFRFGAVFSNRCILPLFRPNNPDIIVQFVGGFGYNSCHADFTKGQLIHINRHLFIRRRSTYVISEKDLSNINESFANINKSEIRELLFPGPKKSNYITIALNRYQNAFLNAESFESQISYAISCLEALFSASPGELKRKLYQRISKIFNIIGFNPLIIYDIISRAYNVRSNYSHGVVTTINREKLEKLSKSILQCARISLLFFLQIDGALQKKKNFAYLNKKEIEGVKEAKLKKERKKIFLKIIDLALIDDNSYKKLKRFIQKNTGNYLT